MSLLFLNLFCMTQPFKTLSTDIRLIPTWCAIKERTVSKRLSGGYPHRRKIRGFEKTVRPSSPSLLSCAGCGGRMKAGREGEKG
jgi:hypothetical protein